MLAFFKTNLLWADGLPIAIVLGVLGVLAFIFFRPSFYVVLAVFFFSLWFFRNPDRVCRQALGDASILVCPADGKVVDIQYDAHKGLNGFSQRVAIFLSPLDVHVNWVPSAGTVKKITYKPGQFKMAFLPKSSELNERNDLLLHVPNGKTILVRQIAGTIARRICCWVKEGDHVSFGQKYGMIRFGSRVEIFLPEDVTLNVGIGQRVYGGQTVLGKWK